MTYRCSKVFVVMVLVLLFFQVGPAYAASHSAGAANDHTVLILSTSVYNGASSVEAVQAEALGFTVEMADASQWAAKSQADFASYRALIIGDNRCATTSSFIQAAMDNRTTWGPAINGNIILVGGDPEYHAVYGTAGATALIKNSIGFAGDEPTKTGLYAAFGCLYYAAPESGTNVTFLDYFGTFTVRGISWNDIHMVASHPALTGLTDALLSNWGSSTHAGFTSFPASFDPLAIQNGTTGNGIITFLDGTSGTPFLLARGEGLVVVGEPSITSITPNHGPISGGTEVTIVGTDLVGGVFTFDGITAVCTVNVAGTEASCTTPAHIAGAVDVVVTVEGKGTDTSIGGYTYDSPNLGDPTLISVNPAQGPITGGSVVTVIGTNLTGGTFSFGGSIANCTVNQEGTQATCTTPAHTLGLVSVVVTIGSGGPTATLPNAYTYVTLESLPATGFAPNIQTSLPLQPEALKYSKISGMLLEIPDLGIKSPIVGVPVNEAGEWDLSWLGSEVGWLNGSAFPTWNGNSVLTAHSIDSFGKPGVFAALGDLHFGNEVIIHSWGQVYVFEIRSVNSWVSPSSTSAITQHQKIPWLTLITCHGYNEMTDNYNWRTIVKAVLVEVTDEK